MFTNSSMSRSSLMALFAVAVLGSSVAHAQEQGCYLVADSTNPDTLTYFDQSTNVETTVGGITRTDNGNNITNIEALALDPSTRRVYAAAGGLIGEILTSGFDPTAPATPAAQNRFVPLGNVTSGLTPADGVLGNINLTDIDGLSFDPRNREFWGCHRRGGADLLFRMDASLLPGGAPNPLTFGRVVRNAFGPNVDYVPIQAIGSLNDCDDLGMSPNGELFVIMNNGGLGDTIAVVDKTNGNTTSLGQSIGLDDMEGLSMDVFNQLVGTQGFGGGRNFNLIDRWTGEGSLVFTPLTFNDYEAIKCFVPGCGDGTLTAPEECDDGNIIDGDGCSAGCNDEDCGDGYINTGEGCDDNNTANDDGCSSTCQIEPGNECTGQPSLCLLDIPEPCTQNSDCLTGLCHPVLNVCTECGSGSVENTAEACDDGNYNNNDNCSELCLHEAGELCVTDSQCDFNICTGPDFTATGGAFDQFGVVSFANIAGLPNGTLATFNGSDRLAMEITRTLPPGSVINVTLTRGTADGDLLFESTTTGSVPNDLEPSFVNPFNYSTGAGTALSAVGTLETVAYTVPLGATYIRFRAVTGTVSVDGISVTEATCGAPTAPVANDDPVTIAEDAMIVTIDADANDTDVDNDIDPTTLTITTDATNGVTTNLGNGSIMYLVDADYNGPDTIVYEICDVTGLCDSASINITVTPDVDVPVAVDDIETTDEDVAVTTDVVANDTDADGDLDATSVTITFVGTSGDAVSNGNGTVTYTPDADFNGVDTYTYQVCDASGTRCDTADVVVTINPVNDDPVAGADMATTDEDVAVTIPVLDNDSDIDMNPLTPSILTGPANGSLTVNGNGTITYTPNLNFNGGDSFTYQACDAFGGCAAATVNVTVTPVNDAPDAVNDTDFTAEDTPVATIVQTNDTDVDGDMLTTQVTIVSAPTNGTAVRNADNTITYTPDTDFNGTDSYTYRICDRGELMGLCDNATVLVTIIAVNDAPIAVDDTANTPEEQLVNINVLLNDSDVDNVLADFVTFIDTMPTNGIAVVSGDGQTVDYTPTTNFVGDDTFTYQVCDGPVAPPALCAVATVTVTVGAENDAPVAADDAATTPEDSVIDIDVLVNDMDPDGDTLGIEAATLGGTTAPMNGTVSVVAGRVRYTPNANFNGSDSFTYRACDSGPLCDEALVVVTITPVNDEPVAGDDNDTTTEGMAVDVDYASNDNDVDGDTLTPSFVSTPANGTAVFDAIAGTVEYTPDAGFNGTDSFVYEVCDGAAPVQGCDTAVVTIVVTPVNDPPVAVDDTATTVEDTPVVVPVLVNDTDPDGDALTPSVVTPPLASEGVVTVNGNGTLTVSPTTNFVGVFTFTYQACDGAVAPPALCDTATVTVTVTGINDGPQANNDSATTTEDVAVDIPVLNNDTDADMDLLTVQLVTTGSNGTATVVSVMGMPDIVNYVPDADFAGTDTFVYEACDPFNLCDTAVVTVTVNAVNDAPVAIDDMASTSEDTTVAIPVLINDTDVDGDSLVPANLGTPNQGGVVSINGNGTIQYTPATNYVGIETFTYEACDGPIAPPALCDQATVTVTVTADNDAPTAVDDTAMTDEDVALTMVDILGNDTDPDVPETLSATITIQPPNGTASVNGDQTVTYTPDADFNGTDVFGYQVCDIAGACDDGIVTITVNPVNDAPVAVDDNLTSAVDIDVAISVLSNDSDVDGDMLSSEVVSMPTSGTATANMDGTITYAPTMGFVGIDTFTYNACDRAVGDPDRLCTLATVTIDVGGMNNSPDADDDTATTLEDNAVAIDVLDNDNDPDGDSLSVIPVMQPSNGSLVVMGGIVTYTPNANFNGMDSFTYNACDPAMLCDLATVSITITAVNDAPIAVDDLVVTDEDTAITISVLDNDSDVEMDPITTDGVVPLTGPANGMVVDNMDGTFTYTPSTGYNGLDSFSYSVCDTEPACSTAVVTIDVAGVNNDPTADDDMVTTDEDVAVNIVVLMNDNDPDMDTLTPQNIVGPANGTVVIEMNGTLTYTPAANFNGMDSFTYDACDPFNACDTATVSITVNAVNDPPVANNDRVDTPEETLIVVSPLDNDTDVDIGDVLTASLLTMPTDGVFVDNMDGTYSFTPNADFNGSVSFTYEVCDIALACDTATVTIDVLGVNDAPVAVDDTAMTDEDTAVNILVLNNDNDPDGDGLVLGTIVQPANGTALAEADGSITYTPDANFNGVDTFTYNACDGSGLCSQATVTVTVGDVNDVPVANDDFYTTPTDTARTLTPLLNDTDADGDMLTAVLTSMPVNGTLTDNMDGTFGYLPNIGYVGSDTFTYDACDPSMACASATVTIEVGVVNDAPIAVDDMVTTDEDVAVNIDVLDNDSDPEMNPLTTRIIVQQPLLGSAVIEMDGTITYTPNMDVNGTDTFSYEVCDDQIDCSIATVTVTITPVPDAPIARDDTATTALNTSVVVQVLSNDIDPDGDALTTTMATDPANGTTMVNVDGTVSYAPDTDFNGMDTFDYTVCDPGMLCSTATVTIIVEEDMNQAPVAEDDFASTPLDIAAVIDVLFNDSDPDGDSLTVQNVSTPSNGMVMVNVDNTVTYTPDAGFVGVDTFTYDACDAGGLCDDATVTVTVGATPGDSDLDGIPDAIEDANGNSMVDPGETNPFDADTDGDGYCDGANTVAGVCDEGGEDTNNDGVLDPGESDPLDPCDPDDTTAACLLDTDGDGIPNAVEDDNNNGVVDAGETDPNDADTDGDGYCDGANTVVGTCELGGEDTNNDGVLDPGESDPLNPCDPDDSSVGCMTDSDNDGIPDAIEDFNGNGVVDPGETDPNNPDTDGDSLCDGYLAVTGICIGGEDTNANGFVDPGESDPLDPCDPFNTNAQCDSDNDGIPDGIEDANGNDIVDPGETDPADPDTDGDGLCDGGGSVPNVCQSGEDLDNNGDLGAGVGESNPLDGCDPFPNSAACDSDGDGLPNGVEDPNGNGVVDPGETDPNNADTDGDGFCDGANVVTGSCEMGGEDANNDGVLDPGESDPLDPCDPDPASASCLLDTDGDGIPDAREDGNGNGMVDPGETDPNNADTDGDGFCDGSNTIAGTCDNGGEDLNNDGDLGSDPGESNPLNPCDPNAAFDASCAVDTDGDGIVDRAEDVNGDGNVDANETDPNNADTDGDGLCDGSLAVAGTCETGEDLNNDGDLGTDPGESNPLDPCDPSRSAPTCDSDGDGVPDGVEDENGNGVVDAGETDFNDPDTDGDGFCDGAFSIADACAEGGEDANGDGVVDVGESDPLDPCDPNTSAPTCDGDNDGIPDGIEDANGNGMVDDGETDPNDPDTDGDGVCDGSGSAAGECLAGEDLNNNGVIDANESDPLDPCDPNASSAACDTDGDGIPDGIEDTNGNGEVDDGETDPNDPDTDNDGFCDGSSTIAGECVTGEDLNGDGEIGPSDDESDPLDPCDPDANAPACSGLDSDGDGIPDAVEDANNNGIVDDGETDPNNADTDGDGLCDGSEDVVGTCTGGEDLNNDGDLGGDAGETNPLDPCDPDPDSAACLGQCTDGAIAVGIADGGFPAGGSGTWEIDVTHAGGGSANDIVVVATLSSTQRLDDARGDGWSCDIDGDVVTCDNSGPLEAGTDLATLLLDVTTDADQDGENVTIGVELQLNNDCDVNNNSGAGNAVVGENENDRDGDGVLDDEDNCPDIANSDQVDTDGDGDGDACDADADGDGFDDDIEATGGGCACDASNEGRGSPLGGFAAGAALLLIGWRRRRR